MKILQLCNKPPLPAIDGGCLAMHSITEGLMESEHSVKVFAIATKKHPLVKEKFPEGYEQKTGFESVFIDTKVKATAAIKNLFSDSSLNIDRFYSAEAEQKIADILSKEKFDVIIFESLYMSPYMEVVRKNSEAKLILRAHNVEHILWERRAGEEKDVLKRKWFNSLAKKMKSAELSALKEVDALLPITEADAKTFTEFTSIPSVVIPFAVRTKNNTITAPIVPKTVFHIGAMDWDPNILGIQWFVKDVWPLVLELEPDAALHLAGKALDRNDKHFIGKHIFNHGEVESAEKFKERFAVMIVPLLSGGGMTIKIVEALNAGKVIVTTTIGSKGTGIVNGVHGIIADEPAAIATGIVSLLKDPELHAHISANARLLAEEQFSLRAVTNKMIGFFSTLTR